MSQGKEGDLFDIEPNVVDIQRVDRLTRLAGEIAMSNMVYDPIEPPLLKALIPMLTGEPGSVAGGELRAPLAHFFAWMRAQGKNITDGIATRKIEGGTDKQLRHLSADYPARGDDPELYHDVLGDIDGEELFWDMLKPLRYNDPDAHKVITSIINSLSRTRWGRPVVLDTGIAFGAGTRKMKLYGKYPFQPTQALVAPRKPQDISDSLPPDNETQELVDKSLDQSSPIEVIVGYDILPPNSEDLELGSSETFLMSRRLREPDAVDEFHRLFDETHSDIVIPKVNIDATNPEGLEKLLPFLPKGEVDVFVFSGVIMLFPEEQIMEILNSFRALASPNAVAIISEWAENTGDGLELLKGAHWQHKGGFKTFVAEMSHLEKSLTEVCRYTNRHGRKMVFSEAGKHILRTGEFPPKN